MVHVFRDSCRLRPFELTRPSIFPMHQALPLQNLNLLDSQGRTEQRSGQPHTGMVIRRHANNPIAQYTYNRSTVLTRASVLLTQTEAPCLLVPTALKVYQTSSTRPTPYSHPHPDHTHTISMPIASTQYRRDHEQEDADPHRHIWHPHVEQWAWQIARAHLS